MWGENTLYVFTDVTDPRKEKRIRLVNSTQKAPYKRRDYTRRQNHKVCASKKKRVGTYSSGFPFQGSGQGQKRPKEATIKKPTIQRVAEGPYISWSHEASRRGSQGKKTTRRRPLDSTVAR